MMLKRIAAISAAANYYYHLQHTAAVFILFTTYLKKLDSQRVLHMKELKSIHHQGG